LAEQLKGLYQEAIVDFTVREFQYRGRKISLETKEDLRARLHRSPDDGDAVAGLVEIARVHGVVAEVTGSSEKRYIDVEEVSQVEETEFAFEQLDPQASALAEAELQ
jgi:hypothetical protein